MSQSAHSKPVVLVYRHTLGKASEPWVWAQPMKYEQYEPVFLCREQAGPIGNFADKKLKVLAFGEKFQGRLGRFHHALSGSSTYALRTLREANIRPDLIHAHFAFDAVYAAPIAKSLGIPLGVTLHGIDVAASDRTLMTSGNASWIKLFLNRKKLGGEGAYFLGVSDYICRLAGRHYPREKITRGFLGIDESQFEFSEVPSNKMILHIGRLVEKKGTLDLLHAFAQVRVDHPDATLVIVGDGPLGPKLKEWINSHHLTKSVRMIPKASREEIAMLLRECRLFCLPSVTAANGDTEGLPISILEAMAVGRPVISTWHAGIPEAVADTKSGYLVPERDIEALAARMRTLLGDLDLCRSMGRGGRLLVESRFSLHKCALRTEQIYSEILSEWRSKKCCPIGPLL